MGREVEEWVSRWVDGFEVGCWDSRDVIHRKGKGRRKIYCGLHSSSRESTQGSRAGRRLQLSHPGLIPASRPFYWFLMTRTLRWQLCLAWSILSLPGLHRKLAPQKSRDAVGAKVICKWKNADRVAEASHVSGEPSTCQEYSRTRVLLQHHAYQRSLYRPKN